MSTHGRFSVVDWFALAEITAAMQGQLQVLEVEKRGGKTYPNTNQSDSRD
jgi:hypothetical protein